MDALSIGARAKSFWSASRQPLTSICFKIELDLDGLILVLIFEIFLSTFVEMAHLQGIKDSSDIFLSDTLDFFYKQLVYKQLYLIFTSVLVDFWQLYG